MELNLIGAFFDNIDELPRYQDVPSPVDQIASFTVRLWFENVRRECDDRVRRWSQDLSAALVRGETGLPEPAVVSEWVEPTLRRWMEDGAVPRGSDEVRFVPADPQVDSRSPSIEWATTDGAVIALRCRCVGESIEIVGIERR